MAGDRADFVAVLEHLRTLNQFENENAPARDDDEDKNYVFPKEVR